MFHRPICQENEREELCYLATAMTDPLPPIAQPDALTETLRRNGALTTGRVTAVAVEAAFPTVLSRITRLRLANDGAAEGAPRALVLKTGHPDRKGPAWQAGRHEGAFYRDVAPATPAGLVPRCFEATWREADNDWHLLLEDLTESHANPGHWPVPPDGPQCARIVAAFARFHAAWWNDARLGASIGEPRTDQDLAEFLARCATLVERFGERMGDRLSPARRDLYARWLEVAPRLLASQRGRLTIVHGDAHAWNCLLPRDPASDDTRLFDWDSWRLGLGTDDLAYLMAMHWYPERRRALEQPLLDRYHAALLAGGVRDYDRAALDADYRASVLAFIMRPLFQWSSDIPPVIWWNNLERIMLAVEDLGCGGLLKG